MPPCRLGSGWFDTHPCPDKCGGTCGNTHPCPGMPLHLSTAALVLALGLFWRLGQKILSELYYTCTIVQLYYTEYRQLYSVQGGLTYGENIYF